MDLRQEQVSIETDRYRTEGALTLPSEGPRLRHRRYRGRRGRAAARRRRGSCRPGSASSYRRRRDPSTPGPGRSRRSDRQRAEDVAQVVEAQRAQSGALQRGYVAAGAAPTSPRSAALRAGEDKIRRLRMALAPAAGLRPRQLALAAGLDHAERLLVEVDRAPAPREQLAAAAQAGERGGDVERPVAWDVFVTLPVPRDDSRDLSQIAGNRKGRPRSRGVRKALFRSQLESKPPPISRA